MKDFVIRYVFTFPDGKKERFPVRIDGETLDLISPLPAEPAPWTALEFHRCANCNLPAGASARCPASLALQPLVDVFSRLLSYEELRVMVFTPERMVAGEVPAQGAVSSLMGLVLATSGCPHTAFLRPMARFHLPLSSDVETFYRASSMYMLAQYFILRKGLEPDLDLSGLKTVYADLQRVNFALADRLRAASEVDSTVNALVLLDLFARGMPAVIEESLGEIRHLFRPYLEG